MLLLYNEINLSGVFRACLKLVRRSKSHGQHWSSIIDNANSEQLTTGNGRPLISATVKCHFTAEIDR